MRFIYDRDRERDKDSVGKTNRQMNIEYSPDSSGPMGTRL